MSRREYAQVREWLTIWSRRLGIDRPIRTERTSIWQVCRHDGTPGCSLVGVVWDEHEACIYHTRRLTEEDVVHELLHVANSDWSEAQVVAETARLLEAARPRERVSRSFAASRRRATGGRWRGAAQPA